LQVSTCAGTDSGALEGVQGMSSTVSDNPGLEFGGIGASEGTPRFMSVRQVARYLHINEKKVYALVNEGKIPASMLTGNGCFRGTWWTNGSWNPATVAC
jgi:excisionase family DNA binding protein